MLDTTKIEFGTPGEIRTPDQLVRSQLLYPAELRAHNEEILYTLKIAGSLQLDVTIIILKTSEFN